MKLLILTQYFPPEVGAPQNRLHELAVRLQEKGMEVSVLTAMPNYPQMNIYEGYQGKWYLEEQMGKLRIHRSWIYAVPGKGIFTRLLNYFSFVFSSFFAGLFKVGKVDYILCESPPLFLGMTAVALKKIKDAKLLFNVSDLWPESAERLGLVTNSLFLKMATKLEEFLYRQSDLISGQTQGIVRNISSRFPTKNVYWLPNGVDLQYYDVSSIQSSWRSQNGFNEDDFIVLYAGIIGHAQGLDVILHAAARLKNYSQIKFVLLGSGPEKEKLLELKKIKQVDQVYFFDAIGKKDMPAAIAASSAAVVPLKRLELFKGAIPSKIFENLAMKKPLLLGVEGEANELFIIQGNTGLAFIPEDDRDLAEKTLQLFRDPLLTKRLGENGLRYVQEKFTRDKIATEFYNWIITNQ
jgi:glycosyltransferase involved in cell wall biosynthesis